jgi:hypothetical protein
LQALTGTRQSLAKLMATLSDQLVQLTAVAAVLLTSGGTLYQRHGEVVKKNLKLNCYKLETGLRGWVVVRAQSFLVQRLGPFGGH